jgi:hypothetical protein
VELSSSRHASPQPLSSVEGTIIASFVCSASVQTTTELCAGVELQLSFDKQLYAASSWACITFVSKKLVADVFGGPITRTGVRERLDETNSYAYCMMTRRDPPICATQYDAEEPIEVHCIRYKALHSRRFADFQH